MLRRLNASRALAMASDWISVNEGLTLGMRFANSNPLSTEPLLHLLDERAKVDAHGVVLNRDTFPGLPS